MPVHKTKGGYKYGETGKTYKDKKSAIKQAIAIAYSKAEKKGRKPSQEEIHTEISGNPDSISKSASMSKSNLHRVLYKQAAAAYNTYGLLKRADGIAPKWNSRPPTQAEVENLLSAQKRYGVPIKYDDYFVRGLPRHKLSISNLFSLDGWKQNYEAVKDLLSADRRKQWEAWNYDIKHGRYYTAADHAQQQRNARIAYANLVAQNPEAADKMANMLMRMREDDKAELAKGHELRRRRFLEANQTALRGGANPPQVALREKASASHKADVADDIESDYLPDRDWGVYWTVDRPKRRTSAGYRNKLLNVRDVKTKRNDNAWGTPLQLDNTLPFPDEDYNVLQSMPADKRMQLLSYGEDLYNG